MPHFYCGRTTISSTSQVEPEVAVPLYLNAIRVFDEMYELKDTFPLGAQAQLPVDNTGLKAVHVARLGLPEL